MGLKTKKILGIDVTLSQSDEILEEIRKDLIKVQSSKSKAQNEQIKPLVIFTPNPEIINYAQKDEAFKEIVNSAQINLPDGVGVVWALKKIYGLDIERIQGVDFMLELVKMAEKESLRIGLIGGKGEVALHTRECLLSNRQNLEIEVFGAPEIEISKIKNQKSKIHIKDQEDKDTSDGGRLSWQVTDSSEVEESEDNFISLVNEIRDRKISILFVALGFPKQEYFIARLARQFQISNFQPKADPPRADKFQIVLMAVGGAFDYISGGVPRAPKWMRNMGLEWLFRLIREPWRLFRQLKGAEFFWKVLNS